MVFVPLTGYLTARSHTLPVKAFGFLDLSQSAQNGFSQTMFDLARQTHAFGTKLIIALLLLHIGAALYHRLVQKDTVLASITTAKRV